MQICWGFKTCFKIWKLLSTCFSSSLTLASTSLHLSSSSLSCTINTGLIVPYVASLLVWKNKKNQNNRTFSRMFPFSSCSISSCKMNQSYHGIFIIVNKIHFMSLREYLLVVAHRGEKTNNRIWCEYILHHGVQKPRVDLLCLLS